MKIEVFLSDCLMLSVAENRARLTNKEISHREPRYAAFISTYLTFVIAMSKHLASAEWRAHSGSSALKWPAKTCLGHTLVHRCLF